MSSSSIAPIRASSRAIEFDGRASAITASSKRMLEALGVWEAIAPHAQPMNAIVVTDALGDAEARPALLQFGEAEHHGRPSAFMVENRHLYGALLDRALASPHIELRSRVGGHRITISLPDWRGSRPRLARA